MTLSTIISITISLTFIYLVLSIVTSEIQEIIANIVNLRAKNFRQCIISLLGEKEDNSNLIIKNFNDFFDAKEDRNKFPITNKIYENFLTADLDKSTEQITKSMAVSNIEPKRFAYSLISTIRESLNNKEARLSRDDSINNEERLEYIIYDIKKSSLPEKLKTDLTYLLQKSKNKLNQTEKELQYLEDEIQDWFDYSMKYASEIYKKKAEIISFVLGLILVLSFNIDTINIINQLSKSEILVSTFNHTAIEFIQSNSEMNSCSEADREANIKTCITDIQEQLNIALDNIDNLPIGWNWSAPLKEQFSPLNIPHVFNAIVGWLISAIAVSMGAPFWFTVLRNLMNFKSTQASQKTK